MPKSKFDLKNLPIEAQDKTISESDFKLVDSSKRSHEEKFKTRPTTFFKDSLKRFAKNKSSVVASVILGLLLVLSFVIPVVDQSDVSRPHPEMTYLEPKLFDKGGFWDGTKKWSEVPTYVPTLPSGEADPDQSHWKPDPERFKENAVSDKKFSDVTYTNGKSKYGKSGYIQFGYYSNLQDDVDYVSFKTRQFDKDLLATDEIILNTFDTYNEEKLQLIEGNKPEVKIPENYELGKAEMYFCYEVDLEGDIETEEIKVLDAQEVFNIGSAIASKKSGPVNLTDKIRNTSSNTSFKRGYFEIRLNNELNHKNTCVLLRALEFSATTANPELKREIEASNFVDATECILRKSDSLGYWASTSIKNIYLSKIVYCSFVYDSYEAVFGEMDYISFPIIKLEEYAEKGWITWDVDSYDDASHIWHVVGDWEILDESKSPVVEFLNVECDPNTGDIFVDVRLSYYKYYGYETMPKFLMGTDKSGKDMLKYVFEGLRTSLLLGILTFVVCFLFGLVWGSVSGYFGGTVDLIMERFTDILAGVPWIIVMTLAIIKLGSTFWTFALALCLTGWIGTAATTRTQFYRFRSREYVLASRTLGASDARLIAKHILPNAMGTIITSAVLMIPSVIFSEATISYLGLGLKNLSSLGVILSSNQQELTTNSYLLIFPSIVIALLMISFNLFGNGLRDAVNPSLKGED